MRLLFYKIVDYNAALLCVDGQDLPPVADDHKIQVRIGGRERTRAVRIYRVSARKIHWEDLATIAHGLRGGEISVSVKGHEADARRGSEGAGDSSVCAKSTKRYAVPAFQRFQGYRLS